MGHKTRPRSSRKKQGSRRMLHVTYPDGRSERVPDDGRSFPEGTMLEWDERQPAGHDELRWCVTGGGWPFDD